MNAADAMAEVPQKVLDNRRRVKEWNQRNPEYANGPRNRFAQAKSKAKGREIEWGLTYDEWVTLVLDADCEYCEERIKTLGISLDRKDSDRGYTLDNVVPCCGDCNKIKNDVLSYTEMKFLMPLLREFRRSQES